MWLTGAVFNFAAMSRAFIKEDGGGPGPRYHLPPRNDPGFDAAAAWALLEGANVGDSLSAEEATGYRWGESRLRPHVERFLAEAKASGNERLEQLAQRFLRAKHD
jgi:hypothetical protein